jgi:hypothetical protein
LLATVEEAGDEEEHCEHDGNLGVGARAEMEL